MDKLFKDPTYGYVKVNSEYCENIIDSPEFQRLKQIRQTSYESLYPNSSHNRFIHSIGAYYLARKAFWGLKANCEEGLNEELKKSSLDLEVLEKTLELAALLHDIGHSPFSHTGEEFYLDDNSVVKIEVYRPEDQTPKVRIYNQIVKSLDETEGKKHEAFYSDFHATLKGNVAKPHEIMSVIVSLEKFSDYLKTLKVDLELFSRMIIGCTYNTSDSFETSFKNCLIQLINSSIVDVDRLDYLVRDMTMTGFGSTQIDYERLLGSISLIRDEDTPAYYWGYRKSALSVLENVILAHDSERKWIQNHPIVFYDSYLISQLMKTINEKYIQKDNTIFTYEAISKEGIKLESGLKIKLFCDADIIHLAKQDDFSNEQQALIEEYFNRDIRKKPIWKSESEFNIVLNDISERHQKILFDTFANTHDFADGIEINKQTLNDLMSEKEKYQNDKDIDPLDKKESIKKLEKKIFWFNALKVFSETNELEFSFYSKRIPRFKSNISKLNNKNVMIKYNSFDRHQDITKVITTYSDSRRKFSNNNYFYMYYKNRKGDKAHKGIQRMFVIFLKKTLEEYETMFFLKD